MNDNFRGKLQAYERGELDDEEARQVEQDLERLEAYQAYLDETIQGEVQEKDKTKKWVRKGKWRARFHNAGVVVGIIFAGIVLISIVTILFYGTGSPSRMEAYPKAIKATVATTMPNVTVGSSGANASFLHMNYEAELRKQVGGEQQNQGELVANFLLHAPSIQMNNQDDERIFFWYPEQQELNEIGTDQWIRRLEKLPEGTVSEVFVSFSTYFTTDELLKELEDKEVMPVWFAVDTGPMLGGEHVEPVSPLGFPYHSPALFMEEKTTKKSGNFLFSVTEGSGSYSVNAYGDGEKRNEDFIKMLKYMLNYDQITQEIAWRSKDDLARELEYIQTNGVRIYGMVVTGPTKSLLTLKDEDWVGNVQVGDVALWNWYE